MSELPHCSIVIPAYNRWELTRQCLLALGRVTWDISHEVLLVDNGSSDGTADAAAALDQSVRVLRNPQNLGFAAACNQGARAARAPVMLFLNNDTVPEPGWLPPLLEVLAAQPDVGVVGSKLLYPHTRLVQHAGVVVDAGGVPVNGYRLFPEDAPEVNFSRKCLAVTGASLAIRREQFLAAGGFDEAFRNGYEDIDLCLRMRHRGLASYYCCQSVLLHFESMSQGRHDHDDANHQLLCSRWRDVLEQQAEDLRRPVARMAGAGLFKVTADGRYVMLRGQTLYRCDCVPPEVRTVRSPVRRAWVKAYYRLRYYWYRRAIRNLAA